MRFELLTLQAEQRRPVETLGHDPVEAELVLLLGHLQEQQVGQLLDVVAVRQAVIPQDVAVVPELVDDRLGIAHDPSPSRSSRTASRGAARSVATSQTRRSSMAAYP